jgi:hypothetical protein
MWEEIQEMDKRNSMQGMLGRSRSEEELSNEIKT